MRLGHALLFTLVLFPLCSMSLMKFGVFLSDKRVWAKFFQRRDRVQSGPSKWVLLSQEKQDLEGCVAQRSSQYVADGFRAATVIALISIY